MKSWQLKLSGLSLYVLALLGTYVGFNQYARNASSSLVDVFVKSEAAAFQQGNLISSVTKLQSAIVASDNLRGVAAYDLSSDPRFKLPLIVLGRVVEPRATLREQMDVSTGFFSRIIVRPIGNDKALLFYFNSSFAGWSFVLFALTLTLFSGVVAALGMKLEHIRSTEQASALLKISRQVAHDIASPLSALKISADALARKNVPVDLLRAGIARIEEIVKDLQSSALKDSRSRKSAPFELSAIVSGLLNEKTVEHAGHRFSVELTPGLHAEGDPAQYSRVVSNVINNAVEASPAGTLISVHLGKQRNRNVLTVRDQGKGIAPEQLKHVFKEGASFGKTRGSGLGLHHAQQILRAMGGEILITSTVNEGTSVSLICPAQELGV